MQRMAADRDAARSTIRMLEALVRLAQAHARLMFRKEVLVMDAVYAIILMEGAQNTPSLLPKEFSVLKSEFPPCPHLFYKEMEAMILSQMGIDEHGHNLPAQPCAGFGGVGGAAMNDVATEGVPFARLP